MALFKQLRGNRASLNTQELHDGYAYFCTDDGTFHIDYLNDEGNLQRKQINAQDAATLCGMSLDEIKEYIKNDNVVYIQGGLTPFAPGITVHNGDKITIKIDKSKITEPVTDSWTTETENLIIFFTHGDVGGNGGYGWNTSGYPGGGDSYTQIPDGGDSWFNVPEDVELLEDEYSFVYSGLDCVLVSRDNTCDCSTFYIDKGPEKAIYEKDGETKLVTADMVGAVDKEYVDSLLGTDAPNIEGLASEEYVNQKVADLVNSAPETLDTLGELASALKNNANIVDTLNQAIGSKVDKSELSEIVKTTKTINSLALGDTLFKGDTVEFDFNDLGNLGSYVYDSGNRLTYSNVYLVNKDTDEGFKFACNIKKISPTDNTNYFIDIQVYFVEGGEIKQFVFEKSIKATISFKLGWPPVELKLPAGTPTNYSFVNDIKDISNLTYYYEDEHGIHYDSFMPGLGVQKTGAAQDTLVSKKDGVETAIDHYVKVKVDEAQSGGRLVEVVGNKEKLFSINEETDKKINELEDKVKYSDVVNISKFVNPDTNTFYTENEVQGIIPNEGNGSRYVVKTNEGLNYYTYNNTKENVGFIQGNSSFYETTVNGKKLYTSTAVSSIREGSPLRLDKAVKNLASVSFDLHMTGIGQTNRYYPEIALVANEGTRRSVEIQFTCYGASFQLKLLRFGMDTTTLESALPYNTSTNTFDANVKVTLKDSTLTVTLRSAVEGYFITNTYTANLKELYPAEYDENGSNVFDLNLYNLNEVENVYLGLRCDATPPVDWGFSNVVFEKSCWEKGYQIRQDTMYIDLKDNSLYRYTNSTKTKPYPNFERITSTSVYVSDEGKAVYDKDSKTSQLNLSMLSAGQVYTSDSINLKVGQNFYNQEVTFYLNWDYGNYPNGYPNGRVEIDNKQVIYWQFEIEDPYFVINGVPYYKSQEVKQATALLNGTITSIVSNQEPFSSVITKVTTGPKVVKDLLVRTEDNTFGYVGKDEIKNYLKNEKTILVYPGSGDTISFSMQGYSHFQILSLKGEYATSSDGGTPVRKTKLFFGEASERKMGSYYFINSDGALFTSTMAYNSSTDEVSLSGLGSSTSGKVAYIKLFNAEQV